MLTQTAMLTLTERAVDVLKGFCEGGGLRIGANSSSCAGLQYNMALEREPAAEDHVVEQSGIRVFVDPASSMWLTGVVVDFVDGMNGGGFTFENPNAPQKKCACSGGGCG